MSTTRTGYTAMQIALHWIIAAMVVFQLLFGESMEKLVDAMEEGRTLPPTDQALGSAHYWVGLGILGLAAIRLAMRLIAGAPEPAAEGPRWMERTALASHWLFYALLLLVPVTGLLGYYLGDPFADIHTIAKPVFIILIAVHMAAALFHQFWLKDGTLTRMVAPS